MVAYLVRRLLLGGLVLVGISVASFWVIAGHINPLWTLLLGHNENQKAIITERAHLQWSLPHRYWHWASGIFTGRGFGHTILTDEPIDPALFSALAHTVLLVGLALVVVVPASVAVGAIGAHRPGSWPDVLLRTFSYTAWSVPAFLLVLGVQALAVQLAASTGFHGIAITGLPGPEAGSGLHFVGVWAGHLVLPVLTIAVVFVGAYSRYVRTAMLAALQAPYATVARAKGATERRVVLRHALRNSLIPFVSALTLDFGNLFSVSLVVDVMFAQHGLGAYLLESLSSADPLQVEAVMTIAVVAVLVSTLVGDALYGLLDPRIRLD